MISTSVMNGGDVASCDYSSSYELIRGIADFLLSRTDLRPKIGIICGSGLGSVATILDVKKEFSYSEIPHFPRSTVPGHAGKLLFGYMGNVAVMCMQGRVHFYEGYDLVKCVMPVRVMKLCGVTHIIMSNAAGGVNEKYNVGDIMIVKDHVNFLGLGGLNPLRGPNDDRWGPRFVALNKAYDQWMRKKAKEIASQYEQPSRTTFHEGVYAVVGGPNFETVAELRMLRKMGIDAVGMSTATEAIAAHHCGMTVFAFSLITNKCVLEYDVEEMPNHEEVIESGLKQESLVKDWVSSLVQAVGNQWLMHTEKGCNGLAL
uniref:Purine nucleoside phosphorylase n=1 Tax=Lygus hesperus TaxID=30085 RepID=A0A0A9XXL6_LYGHE